MMDQDDRIAKKKGKEQGDATNNSGSEDETSNEGASFVLGKSNDVPPPLAPSMGEDMKMTGSDERNFDDEYEERSRDSSLESHVSESDDDEDHDEDYEEGDDEDPDEEGEERQYEDESTVDEEEEDDDPADYYRFAECCLQIARNDATIRVDKDDWYSDLVWDDTNIFLLGKALIGNTHLRSLRVKSTSECYDTEGGIRALCQGLAQSQLRTLKMDKMSVKVQKRFFQEIEKLSTLRKLMIQETRFDLHSLTTPNQFLTNLTLRGCNLGDWYMTALSKWVFGHSCLLSLELPDNSITDVGVNCICEHWTADAPLRALELQRNQIGSDGAQLLMQEAARHSVFRKLNLSRNHTIGQRGLELIGQELPAIGFNTLILRKCCIELATSTTLEAVQDAVCRALADGLRGNSTLVRLDISFNPLGAKGAQMLMQAAAVHPSLESLSLAGDSTVGLSGIKLIGIELPHTKLKEISLDNCVPRRHWKESPAAMTAGQALLDGVRLNETLTSFSLAGLPPTWNGPIQFFMQVNATCRPLLQSDVVVPALWPYILQRFRRRDKLSQMHWSLREQPWLFKQYLDGDEEVHVT